MRVLLIFVYREFSETVWKIVHVALLLESKEGQVGSKSEQIYTNKNYLIFKFVQLKS